MVRALSRANSTAGLRDPPANRPKGPSRYQSAWTESVDHTYAALVSDDFTNAQEVPAVRSLPSALWRRKWIIVLVTLLVFGLGLARSLNEGKVYRAEGTVV